MLPASVPSTTVYVGLNMPDCTNEQLIESLRACFSEFLTTAIPPNKRPLSKWRQSLERDLTTATENTGRVFFERGGAQAWAAYEAVRPANIRCQGQTGRRHRFSQLDRQTLEVKADLARMLAAVAPHPTVADLISPMDVEARSILARPVDAQHSMLGASMHSKRRRTDERSSEPSAWPFLPPPTPPATRHHEIISLAGAQTGAQTAETDEAVSGAQIQGLVDLLPPYMMDAICKYKKDGTMKAAVEMRFLKGLDLPCAITFRIVDEKVEYIAEKLFNAHLEREGPARVLYYDGDARKGRIGPGTRLECCTIEAIPRLFGPLIAQGNEASPYCQEEKLAGRRSTQTVTMELQQVGQGAIVTLSLGRREGSQIYEKLFPK